MSYISIPLFYQCFIVLREFRVTQLESNLHHLTRFRVLNFDTLSVTYFTVLIYFHSRKGNTRVTGPLSDLLLFSLMGREDTNFRNDLQYYAYNLYLFVFQDVLLPRNINGINYSKWNLFFVFCGDVLITRTFKVEVLLFKRLS